MTVYVLGAGASAHAGYPLCRDLATELRQWLLRNPLANTSYQARIERLHELYGDLSDFEKVVTDIDVSPNGSPVSALTSSERAYISQALRVCIPEFFKSLHGRSAPLYEGLVQSAVRADDVVITFNYDLSLERELKRQSLWDVADGYGFLADIDWLPNSAVRVLKLHGSVNWLGLLFNGNVGFFQGGPTALGPTPRIFGRQQLQFLGYDNESIDQILSTLRRGGGEPALILPTLHKQFFVTTSAGREWESFWNDLWQQAACALRECEKLVIIGYSLPVADERARELLLGQTNRDAETQIYSGSVTSRICREFQELGFRRVSTFGNSMFEDFLQSCAIAPPQRAHSNATT